MQYSILDITGQSDSPLIWLLMAAAPMREAGP